MRISRKDFRKLAKSFKDFMYDFNQAVDELLDISSDDLPKDYISNSVEIINGVEVINFNISDDV